jgi:hypothetical protein
MRWFVLSIGLAAAACTSHNFSQTADDGEQAADPATEQHEAGAELEADGATVPEPTPDVDAAVDEDASTPTVDASADVEPVFDAGVEAAVDSGGSADAGSVTDSGSDAGVSSDAGQDAGQPVDSGVDAGPCVSSVKVPTSPYWTIWANYQLSATTSQMVPYYCPDGVTGNSCKYALGNPASGYKYPAAGQCHIPVPSQCAPCTGGVTEW